jgi:hypothetical protein
MSAPTERERYIDGLRTLASALELHPEIPLPYDGTSSAISFNFLGGEDPRADMAAAARAIPSVWRKKFWGDGTAYFTLEGEVGGVQVSLTAFRDAVCKRVVTGAEWHEVEEVVVPAETRKVRKSVPVVEWQCGPLLAGLPERALAEVTA